MPISLQFLWTNIPSTWPDKNRHWLQRQFCLFIYPPKSKLASSEKIIFSKSVVQSFIQSYSFGGSIKLIICQIRHELSITIHKISTIWKKNVRSRIPYREWFFKSIIIYILIICQTLLLYLNKNVIYFKSYICTLTTSECRKCNLPLKPN